ncbi:MULTISPECIES: relaxase/mobilization nuclease domain-containing protein [Nocardia]|uniref:Relaxase/mobilization nuclease-like protein n=1 Tax=Nocardia ignorata TaxID=145285 RepID=A0A4R6PL77_NOCIG|nr:MULTISPECIES: relaxase/mobilization nuclease domain-containing protein [Nocardia]MBC7300915.1 relaxase/mobilization nuclease domain-containing protein [Nocardia sp.]TDP38530.1 relaxase/mobilization nuclease-like protein [Nocardia ignorata]
MIGKAIRGWDGRRLVRYLFSPGTHNEHTNPRVIAAWQSDPDALQPLWVGPGDCDFAPGEIGKLAGQVTALSEAIGLPTQQPEPGQPGYTKHGYIWHLPVAIGAEDGELDQQTWRRIAEDMLHETGIAKAGAAGACRWIAVHHGKSVDGNDHIHIAAVMVRADTGKRFYPDNDWKAVRRVARRWEEALGLRLTAINDPMAVPTPTRGEQEKAQRRQSAGDEGMLRATPGAAARTQLRQMITESAAVATTTDEFLARLRDAGVLVDLKHDGTGQITGWAVAAPGDVSAKTGEPIYFAPSRHLGADMSWPRVTARWSTTPPAPSGIADAAAITATAREAHTVLADSAERVREVTTAVRAERSDIATVARELHDVIGSWASIADGAARQGPLSQAAWAFDRAARTRHGLTAVPAGRLAAELRAISRDLAAVRMLSGRGLQRDPTVQLGLAVADLLLEIAAWHQQNRRITAARSARQAADLVRAHGEATGTVPGQLPPQRVPASTSHTSTAPQPGPAARPGVRPEHPAGRGVRESPRHPTRKEHRR